MWLRHGDVVACQCLSEAGGRVWLLVSSCEGKLPGSRSSMQVAQPAEGGKLMVPGRTLLQNNTNAAMNTSWGRARTSRAGHGGLARTLGRAAEAAAPAMRFCSARTQRARARFASGTAETT